MPTLIHGTISPEMAISRGYLPVTLPYRPVLEIDGLVKAKADLRGTDHVFVTERGLGRDNYTGVSIWRRATQLTGATPPRPIREKKQEVRSLPPSNLKVASEAESAVETGSEVNVSHIES